MKRRNILILLINQVIKKLFSVRVLNKGTPFYEWYNDSIFSRYFYFVSYIWVTSLAQRADVAPLWGSWYRVSAHILRYIYYNSIEKRPFKIVNLCRCSITFSYCNTTSLPLCPDCSLVECVPSLIASDCPEGTHWEDNIIWGCCPACIRRIDVGKLNEMFIRSIYFFL